MRCSTPQRLRGVPRDASPGLFRRQAKLYAGHVHGQMNARERAGAGVVIRGDRHRYALRPELFNRWTLTLLKKIERARQQYRDRAALRHGLNTLLIQVFDMIGR